MKNIETGILIAAFLLMAFLYVGVHKEPKQLKAEVKRLEAEVKRYEELYLNCQINHDLHMKSHEGAFQLN